MKAPAAQVAALAVCIQVAFKAFSDIYGVVIALRLQQLRRQHGTLAATAQGQDGGLLAGLSQLCGNLVGKSRVSLPSRRLLYRHVYSTNGVADIIEFDPGAYIQQYRIRVIPEYFPGLIGGDFCDHVFFLLGKGQGLTAPCYHSVEVRFGNGLEYLLVRKPRLWQEMQDMVRKVDEDDCKMEVSKEKDTKRHFLYNPVKVTKSFKKFLEEKEWTGGWTTVSPEQQQEVIEHSDSAPGHSDSQTGFIKDRVAIEVHFGKHFSIAHELFAKHLAFYAGDKIDVGIEILPMKQLQSQMSSGVSCYEGELYNVFRRGYGMPVVPLVILGIE